MRREGQGRNIAPGLRSVAMLLVLVWCSGAAHAADEEIQVYMDEMNAPGQFGLDLHMNYVPEGRPADAEYQGQEASQGRFRLTPEFSYGLTDYLELGAYLPLTEIDSHGHFELGGIKGRLKYIAARPANSNFFWGANLEVGRVRRKLDLNPWNAEFKVIGGLRKDRLTLAANIDLDFVVSGPAPSPATLDIAIKSSYELQPGFSIGLEDYTDLGNTRRLRLDRTGDHHIFAVFDKSLGRVDLNLGVGYGYGRPEDRWVIKAIVGVPIDPRQH